MLIVILSKLIDLYIKVKSLSFTLYDDKYVRIFLFGIDVL